MLREGSLFTGTNALGMAASEVFDVEPAWFCDIDPAASALLAHHYPNVPNLKDITRVGLPYSDEEWAAMQARAAGDEGYELPMPDWSVVEPVEVLTGGFPCQDISNAGKREGITGARSGLWSYYADAIRALRPRYVLVENVGALVVRGLDRVLADLAALGFDAEWAAVRASDVGAPHQRERIFIAAAAQNPDSAARGERRVAAPGQAEGGRAWSDAGGRGGAPAANASGNAIREQPVAESGRGGTAVAGLDHAAAADTYASDADSGGLAGDTELDLRTEGGIEASRRLDTAGRVLEWGPYGPAICRWERILGRPAPAPTATGARGGRVLNPVFVEFLMGLPVGHVTGVPGLSRNAALKLLGNGVVPQQAVAAFSDLISLLEAAHVNAA